MGVLKLFEGTGDLECVVATIKTPEGSLQKVVDGSSFSIGRAPDCVLSVPHAGISRLHILVTIKRGEVYIMDQESSNGTFLNGNKIEPKRLTHVKPTDEIKLGLSDVVMQFVVLEKHFKTDYIAESLLPSHEKDNLMALIKASNHKAQEIVASAQAQADHITLVATEKSRNLENQTLLKQEEIITAAQVEAQHFVAEAKRKAAQVLLENEEKAKASVQNIHEQAERIRKEAEVYFQNRVKDAESRGTEIIDHHTKLAHEVVEDIRQKTIQKAEAEVRQQLSSVVKEIEDKSTYLKGLASTCDSYEQNRKKEIEIEINLHKENLLALAEKEKNEKFANIENKIKTLEEDYAARSSGFEKEFSEKASKLEADYASRAEQLQTQHKNRTEEVEAEFKRLSTDLEENNRRAVEEAAAAIIQQKQMLDTEIQNQRQELAKLTADLNSMNQQYATTKSKYDDIHGLLQGLQNSEADIIKSLNEKRDQTKRYEADLQLIKTEVDTQQEKFVTLKNSTEAQIEDYQSRLSKLKAAFEGESLRLKKESEQEVAAYREEFKKAKDEIDQQLKIEKGEIHKKTMDYMDSERARMDEYRSQMLKEKKELDQTFDKTKKDFEAKTKEVIDLEKQKIEEARQNFMANLNRERQVITDDVTIAIMKIKNHESLTATSIAEAVSRVFNSHVTTHSVDSSIKSSKENIQKVKFQFMGYGLGIALALLLGFKVLIQPQINRHIAGTDEHSEARKPVERAKYVAPKTLEYKDNYTDLSVYTQNFSDIYLDEALHDKWFKHIAGYMYETWRVDETKSIEVVSISKTLVQSLKNSATNLDAEFYQKGIEKMRELEAESDKRMIEILGTKVKYEAFKRKEREFFEPYIQNQ